MMVGCSVMVVHSYCLLSMVSRVFINVLMMLFLDSKMNTTSIHFRYVVHRIELMSGLNMGIGRAIVVTG